MAGPFPDPYAFTFRDLYPSNQCYSTPSSCRELIFISRKNSAICVNQWNDVPWRTGVPRTLGQMAAKAGHSATTWWEVSSSSPQLLHKESASSWTITFKCNSVEGNMNTSSVNLSFISLRASLYVKERVGTQGVKSEQDLRCPQRNS